MSAGSTWQRLESSLADYCSAVDLEGKPGLNRALLEMVQGIVFGGSVQLTNAARLYCHDAGELHGAGKRLSARLSDPKVDHHPWLKRLWAYQAGFVKELDPIATPSAGKEHIATRVSVGELQGITGITGLAADKRKG